jgi:hypothetical protein
MTTDLIRPQVGQHVQTPDGIAAVTATDESVWQEATYFQVIFEDGRDEVYYIGDLVVLEGYEF